MADTMAAVGDGTGPGLTAQSEAALEAAAREAVAAALPEEAVGGSGMSQVLFWLAVFFVGYVVLQVMKSFTSGMVKKARSRGQALLILGQSGAGKTALFHRLRDGVTVETVPSLKMSRDAMKLETGSEGDALGPVDVIDYPGHHRLRIKGHGLLDEARCIVYLIDSEDKPKMKDAAEHIYELLTHPDILELHTPILLALNKTDLVTARTEKFILDEINREIEQMRFSRGATLEGQDQADSYLGVDGEKFKIMEHSPCPVRACRISVKKVQLEPVYEFLREHFS